MNKQLIKRYSTKVALLLSFPALFCLVGTGCKKDGVNQNLDQKNQKPFDFMSNKTGSYWTYGSQDGGIYTRYARGKDSVKLGLTFSYYDHKDTSGNIVPDYYGKNNGYYFTLIDLDGSESNYMPYAFWKDSAVKGSSWDNTGTISYSGLSISIKIESTEVDDNVSLKNGDSLFSNLVHVHSEIKATVTSMGIGKLDSWFRKGLGIVREEAEINIAGAYSLKYTDSLINYHLAD